MSRRTRTTTRSPLGMTNLGTPSTTRTKEREISSTNLLMERVRVWVWTSTRTKDLSTWTPTLWMRNPPRNPKRRIRRRTRIKNALPLLCRKTKKTSFLFPRKPMLSNKLSNLIMPLPTKISSTTCSLVSSTLHQHLLPLVSRLWRFCWPPTTSSTSWLL
uniref:Uncharacterized protein n=1 Tax=Cryptococcus bacillisporus CA1280 TaxID=1296109 RepID=A0A0D0VBC9_CRYGA|nr:hypothetical protein I312_05879 [Cryptococcus bacillisporus CA1280]